MINSIKTLAILCMAVCPAFCFAQDEKSPEELKNEGNAFIREKKYQEALASYEQAIAAWGDSAEAATVFNAADCARRIGQFEKSNTLYTKSIEMNYKPDVATYYIAINYGKMDKEDERIKTLEDAYNNKKFVGKYAAQIKKDLAKEYAETAMENYKEGSEILKQAKADGDEFTKKATVEFKEAAEWANKSLEVNPENATAKQIVEGTKDFVNK